jgi:hypothetical protein
MVLTLGDSFGPNQTGNSMTFFLWVVITALLLAVVTQAFSSVYLAKPRRSGRYPERGKATMADVVRLLNNGSRGLANNSPRNAMRSGLKTIALGSVLLGQAFLLDTAGAVCLDPRTFVSGYTVPLSSEVRTADAIVVGRVLAEQGLREDPMDPDGYTAFNVKVKIITRLKGNLPSVVVIRNDNTSARYPMSTGEEHLLFVSRDRQGLWINSCGNSSAMPEGKKVMAQIRAQLQRLK